MDVEGLAWIQINKMFHACFSCCVLFIMARFAALERNAWTGVSTVVASEKVSNKPVAKKEDYWHERIEHHGTWKGRSSRWEEAISEITLIAWVDKPT